MFLYLSMGVLRATTKNLLLVSLHGYFISAKTPERACMTLRSRCYLLGAIDCISPAIAGPKYLPTIMGESLISVRHTVSIFTLLHGRPLAFESIHQLAC